MPGEEDFKSLVVLVVDDMFNMRTTVKNMCRQMGFKQILEAKDGIQAVERLVKETVDLVLCDWNMPQMKGVDVLRFVRSRDELKNLPFIMVTAEMNEGVVAEVAETEVDAYLVKPFTLQTLRQKILEVLGRYGEMSEIDQRLDKGRAYVQTRQFDLAMAEFKAAMEQNPKSPRTLYEIGRLYEEQGNDVQAVAYYERSVAIAPKFLKGHEALSRVYEALGNAEKTLEHLKRAVKISPHNMERRFMLGQACLKNGDREGAKEVFNHILKDATEQFADLAGRVGDMLLEMGEVAAAETAFGKALDQNPGDLRTYNQMGIALRKQGKFDAAIQNYLKAVKLAPRDENLLYNLSRAYFEAKDLDRAQRTIQSALKLNPEFHEAQELLVVIRKQYGLD